MLKKAMLTLFLLCLPCWLFCNKANDDLLKSQYPTLPKTASDVKILNTAHMGSYIEYYEKGKQWAFIDKNGELRDLKKEIYDLTDGTMETDKLNLVLNSFNSKSETVGYIFYFGTNYQYHPFFCSPTECKILPRLCESTASVLTMALSINDQGVIVGYDYKNYERTFYLGEHKTKKTLLCRGIVPVVWSDLASIKEICLYADKGDPRSYLNDSSAKPFYVSIDNDNFIHFWVDYSLRDYSGCVHLSEL